jgi:hypothetical protein
MQGNDAADHRIGAAVARELGLDRGDRAVAGDTEPRSMALIAIGRRRQEVLATCLDPLHRPPEPSRHRRQQHVLGIHVPLGAEAAADVRRDDPYLLFREAQGCSDRRAHSERHLGRRPTVSRPSGASGWMRTPRGSIGIAPTRGTSSRASTTTCASAKPRTMSPTAPSDGPAALSGHSSKTRGAPGASAASTVTAAGNTS